MAKTLTVFQAASTDTGIEPWVTDGTAAGTFLLKDLVPGVNNSNPGKFVAAGIGKVAFEANGDNLYVTDGTTAGTTLLAHLPANPSEAFGGKNGYDQVSLGNGNAVFLQLSYTSNFSGSSAGLYVSDGTAAGTTLIHSFDSAGTQPTVLTAFGNGKALFKVQGQPPGLWVTDGTAAGTKQLSSAVIAATVVLGTGKALFVTGNELWSTDGTVAGTAKYATVSSFNGVGFTSLGNGRAIYTDFNTNTSQSSIYVTDGTAAGTTLVQAGRSLGNSAFAIGNGRAVFEVAAADRSGNRLWITDGTSAGTMLLKDVVVGGNATAADFAMLGNGKVVFQGSDGTSGFELWITDGTAAGTVMLKDLLPGLNGAAQASSAPNDFTTIGNGSVMFRAPTVVGGPYHLWVTDGSAAGTAVVSNTVIPSGFSGASAQFAILTTGGPSADFPYTLTAADAIKADATTGTTLYTFTVARIGSTAAAVTLNYGVQGTGANPLNASLIAAAAGTVTIAAGDSSATLTVAVKGAQLAIPLNFSVALTNAPAATADLATAIGTVLPNLTFAATKTGTTGKDIVADVAGNQLYIGNGGADVLTFTEGLRGNTYSLLGNGDIGISHAGQFDVVHGFGELRFIDGSLVFDDSTTVAAVLRMYQAGLGRAPDQGGFQFWVNALQKGGALSEVANSFLGSAEFTARFGTGLSSTDFVTRIYQNVLGRAPDAGGLAFWRGQIDGKILTFAQTLAGISESAENKTITAPLINAGIWSASGTAQQVARLYDTALGRLPDASGLQYWTSAIDAGTSALANLATSFVTSAEFQRTYGALANRDFVNLVYNNTLHRAGEQGGVDFWTNQLDRGASRASIVTAFSESPEHQALTAANITPSDPAAYGIKFA